MYRLVGGTMQHLHIYQGPFTVKPRRDIAFDALPIPYSLTDLGRQYLMRLRVEEEAVEHDLPLPTTAGVGALELPEDGLGGVDNDRPAGHFVR